MNKVFLTVLGKDQPGIVAEVTKVLYETGCNLEDSSMTILEGEFAMLVVVCLAPKLSGQALKNKFSELTKKIGLYLEIKEFPEMPEKEGIPQPKNYIISLIGADKPGIVHNVAQLMADHGINITDVETKRIGKGERVVYAMILEIDIPKKVDVDALEKEISELGKKLSVDITLKPIESITL